MNAPTITPAEVMAAPFQYPRHVTPAMEREIGKRMRAEIVAARVDLPKIRDANQTSSPMKGRTSAEWARLRQEALLKKLPLGDFTIQDAAAAFDMTTKDASYYLSKMAARGLIELVTYSNRGNTYRRAEVAE